MALNLLTGLDPGTYFNTSYQTWFSHNIFGPSISIYPNYNVPSILGFSNRLNASFSAVATIYLATVNDVVGFAFDVQAGNTTTYNLITAKLLSTRASTNTFQVSISSYNGSSTTTYLLNSVTITWSGSYDYPNISLRVIRIGTYIGVYANNTLLSFGQPSLKGEQVSTSPFLPTNYFIFDGLTPFTDSIGLYINGQGSTGGMSPVYDRIDFANVQIFDLNRDVTLDYFLNDVSALGGIMKYNGQLQFSDNFNNLSNWQ